jgi:chromosome segregation ATPase
LKKVAASEGGEESVSHPPKLSVLRGGGVSQPRSEKAATGSHRSVDAGHLRERNRLLRRARQLEILVGKSKTASVRSQRSLAETERAFDLRRRNLEAAQKAFEESQGEMEKRLARQAELEEQQRELTASLAEVRQELAALDPGGEEE